MLGSTITLARRLTHGGALAWIVALILFVLLLAQRLQFTKEIAAVERRMDSICRMNSYVSRSKNLTLEGRHFTIHHGDKHNCTYDAVDSLTCTEQVSVTPVRAEGRRHLEPHDEDTAYVGLTRDSPLVDYHTMWLKISPARWWGQNVVGTRKVQGSTYLNFMDHENLPTTAQVGDSTTPVPSSDELGSGFLRFVSLLSIHLCSF